jgi:hypothetical protein
MKQRLLLACCAVIVSVFFSSSPLLAAGPDALLQQASSEYGAMKGALVKKYEEQYKRGEELDRRYYEANRKDTIRHQVQAWQSIVTDGCTALFDFVRSEDFDKAHIIYYDNYFNEALRMPVSYKRSWPDEVGPALNAAQRCCDADDSNKCMAQIYEKAFPVFRGFANKIENQIGGFYCSVDQSKLSYYDDYYKKTQRFTYTWPKNAETLLNFLKGDADWERQKYLWDHVGLMSSSLLNVQLRSNEGRLLGLFVQLEVQNESSYTTEHFWLRSFLEDGAVIEEGSNYLVLKRENRYYRLVHFFKGRKSLAVVYTLDTDKTIDAMSRYLILALRDYVVSGATPSPAPGPAPAPAVAQQMEVRPLTTANLTASPGPGNTCTLQVVVSDPQGAPAANAIVVFEQPGLGTLSALQTTTDAQGQTQVIYTAPTEAEMAQQGKKEISVTLNAQAPASGAKDSATLNIRSRTSEMTVVAEHAILPAHHDYYNEIRFRFKAANKKDGSAYQARIIARQQWGALVKDGLQQGGTRVYEMAVWPNSDCTVSYHWVGPPSMMRAADEIVTIEIPELGLKQEVAFSVGIDLAVVAVQRKHGGPLFPVFWEPFHVSITDRFHPNADLAALLKRFNIKTDLKIEQTSYAPAPVNPADTGFLSALFTRIEGSALGSLHDAVIWDAGQWEVQGTADKRFVLIQKGEYEDGKPWLEYPSIVFWERGGYQFQVTLRPGAFDADPRTDTALTEVFTVEEFRGMGDEMVHTVLLPSIEFLAGALAGYSKGLPLKLAFCLKGLAGDIYALLQPHETTGSTVDASINFLCDAFGCWTDVIGESKIAENAIVKELELIEVNTLALYYKTLFETCPVEKPDWVVKKGPAGKATAGAATQPPTRYDLDKVLEIAQLTIKRTRNNYLVILEREGMERSAASVFGKGTLAPAPEKLGTAQSDLERIEQGERFVVIPANNNERLVLQLNGGGGQGRLIVVTGDAVTRYAYPTAAWDATMEIDCTGKATTMQGEVLKPVP